MALLRTENQKQLVVTDDKLAGRGGASPPKGPPTAVRSSAGSNPNPGYFAIYKKGQGKWTRLGTVFAAAGFGIGTAIAMHGYMEPYIAQRNTILGICVGFLLVYSLLIYWVMNRPKHAEFLIATDSEMKKVNWTTQGELFGSTRVVVLFIIIVAVFLFSVDLIFAEFFHVISVLRTSPFS